MRASLLYVATGFIFLALVAIHYSLPQQDFGIHVSYRTIAVADKICPTSCPLYSVDSPAGRIDVICEVDRDYVNKSLPSCVGIESYNNMREVLCRCVPVAT